MQEISLDKKKKLEQLKREYLEILRIFLSMKKKKIIINSKKSNFWSNIHIYYNSNGGKNKTLSVEEYLNKIRPYLKDINSLKKSYTWKIQLAIAYNFISSIDNDEESEMHSKMDNIEIMINDEADNVIEEFFNSLKNRYQNDLKSMKVSEFVFDYVHLLYHKCHKTNPNRGGSYIGSPDWMKNKKATNKCFQCTVTVALNHE